MKTKHYHNTNNVDPITARLEAKKNLRQEDLIYAFFEMTTFKRLSASEVHRMYNSFPIEVLNRILNKKLSEHYKVPLTSIRRGMSNLTKEGYLIKTNDTQSGRYGKQEHFYKLAQSRI